MAKKLLSQVAVPLPPRITREFTVTHSTRNRYSAEMHSQGAAATSTYGDLHYGGKEVHTICIIRRPIKTRGEVSADQQKTRGRNTVAGSTLRAPGGTLQTASVRLPPAAHFVRSRPSFGRKQNGRKSAGPPSYLTTLLQRKGKLSKRTSLYRHPAFLVRNGLLVWGANFQNALLV